jgi:hypothetical protein
MKTNQLMQVAIGDFRLPIEHKTMMGSLTELWNYGNSIRLSKGLGALDLSNYLRQSETLEFLQVVETKVNSEYVKPTDFEIVEREGQNRYELVGPKLTCVTTKRGKGGGTWAHLYVLLDAASRLDANFKFMVYDTFVNHKILQWRDDSGDEFKNLNIAIDAYLTDRQGKDNHWLYVNSAKMLKAKIKPDGDTWNTANYDQLERRTKLESKLVDFLKMGLVRDWDHLKEVITKL